MYYLRHAENQFPPVVYRHPLISLDARVRVYARQVQPTGRHLRVVALRRHTIAAVAPRVDRQHRRVLDGEYLPLQRLALLAGVHVQVHDRDLPHAVPPILLQVRLVQHVADLRVDQPLRLVKAHVIVVHQLPLDLPRALQPLHHQLRLRSDLVRQLVRVLPDPRGVVLSRPRRVDERPRAVGQQHVLRVELLRRRADHVLEHLVQALRQRLLLDHRTRLAVFPQVLLQLDVGPVGPQLRPRKRALRLRLGVQLVQPPRHLQVLPAQRPLDLPGHLLRRAVRQSAVLQQARLPVAIRPAHPRSLRPGIRSCAPSV